MLTNVLNNEKRVLGLDIGSSNLKMVEIKHNSATANSMELVTYGVYKHDLNLDGFWDNEKIDKFAKTIELIRKNANFKTMKTVVALPAKHVFVTTMDFEASWSKKMIQDEINRQARYFLPYPPDEMKVSWNLTATNETLVNITGKQRVIINALPNFVVTNITNLLNRCNLEGVAFENQTLSLARAVLKDDKKNTILVDIGSVSTTYSIIVDGTLRNSYTSSFGVRKLDEILSSSLGISVNQAESFKKDLGLVNLFELPNEVINHINLIKGELASFYQQNVKIAQNPEQVIVTGGGVLTPGIISSLGKNCIPIPIYEGKVKFDLQLTGQKKLSFAPLLTQFSTAIGLALREI
jgi:type IV pilus assembly protein PilM